MISKLAFVVPAFNAAETLADTIASILAQKDGDWQAIIVDDGSTDGTAQVARRSGDPRVMVVRQANAGLSAARNSGLAEARSELVCFLDADDVVSPEFTGTMMRTAVGADLAACATRMVGPGLEDLGWEIMPGDAAHETSWLAEFNAFSVGSIVLRRDAMWRLGVVERGSSNLFDRRLPCHEDWDAWSRLTLAGARWAPVCPNAMFSYRIRPGSMSTNVERMHTVGLAVIERASVDAAARASAQRRWTVRHVARAIAARDEALAARLLATLRGLNEAELGVMAGALRHAFCLAEAIGPAHVDRERETRWRDAIAAALRGEALCDAVVARAVWDGGILADAAREIERRAGERDVAVLYGMGRRGRTLAGILIERGLSRRVAWVDDDSNARGPEGLARLRPDVLTDRHLVVVTAQDDASIGAGLRARGLKQWWTIEGLASHGRMTAGCAPQASARGA